MTILHPDLLQAYNRDPTDLILLGALADDCRENGRDDIAELLDSMREHKWVPTRYGSDWGWWDTKVGVNVCEDALWSSSTNGDRTCPAGQLIRLVEGHLKVKGRQATKPTSQQ